MSEFYIDSSAEGGLPPTVPPPEWIANVSCYSPELLNNLRYFEEDAVSAVDVAKSLVLLVTAALALALNAAFLVVLNTPHYAKR